MAADMVRRRSPPPADIIVPEGWAAHDGSGIPVPRESRPAVMFRGGVKMRAGAYPARHWSDMDADCWVWQPILSNFDIIAWKAEPDELIDIPRLQ